VEDSLKRFNKNQKKHKKSERKWPKKNAVIKSRKSNDKIKKKTIKKPENSIAEKLIKTIDKDDKLKREFVSWCDQGIVQNEDDDILDYLLKINNFLDDENRNRNDDVICKALGDVIEQNEEYDAQEIIQSLTKVSSYYCNKLMHEHYCKYIDQILKYLEPSLS